MKLLKNIQIIDLALFVDGIVVLSDLHIGYEESLNKQGILVPRFQFNDLMKRVEKIFSKVKNVRKIIIAGDLKHEFGTISETEWRHTLKLLDFLTKQCKDIILLKGNHDTILGPIAKKRSIVVKDTFVHKDMLFLHGHKVPKKISKNLKTIIMGHAHPAISFKERRSDKFKCFLLGKWKKYNLIVMPSLNLVTEGIDIATDKLASPFLEQNLDNFKVFVVSDKVYEFGRLKNLR